MSPLEMSLSLVAGLAGAGGVLAWVRTHTHVELVSRRELDSLKELMRSQHAAVLRELESLRDSLES